MRRSDGKDFDPLATGHLKQNLAARSVSGSLITLSAQAVKVGAQFLTIALLARLLTPTDFGQFAIVLALLSLFELCKDLGLSGATVQRAQVSRGELSTLFWLNTGLGALIAATLALASPYIAEAYDEPILSGVLSAAAITLVFTGIAAQHLALLRRQMRFKTLAIVQSGAEIAGMCAALVAALQGFGIWSLVVQRLVWGTCIMAGALLTSGWVPGRPVPLAAVSGHLRFGLNATGAMVLGRAGSTLDKLIIGLVWGAAPLGLFERSQKLTMMPVQNICTPLASVALPMLSRLIDDPSRYRDAYLAVARRIAMVTAPGAALVFASADNIVLVVLGDQWRGAAPILSWLGISLLYMPITYTLGWLYMSQDRTPEMLRANTVNVLVSLTTMVCALPFGPVAIAVAYALGGAVMRVPFLLWYVGRRGPVGAETFARVFYLPTLAAVLGAVLIEFARGAVPAGIAGLSIDICIAALSAVGVYLLSPDGRRTILQTLSFRKHLVGTRTNS